MNIIVLGTAAATSFPLPFCKCNVCNSARIRGSKDFRRRSSIIINGELLIDMGPDCVTSSFLYGVDISKVKYLLQTHSHADHFDAGIFVTRHKEYATKNPAHLKIICSKGTFDDINHWVKMQEPEYDLYKDENKISMNYSYMFVANDDIVKLGDYQIHAIDSLHDSRVEALIYVISYQNINVLYATDLLMITDDAWEILKKYKLNVIFIDQTYGKGFNAGGHTDAGMIENYVAKMKALNIIDENTLVLATHLSHEGNDIHSIMEEKAQKCDYHIAYDGMEINIEA